MCVYFLFFFRSTMREGPQLKPRTKLANHDRDPQPFVGLSLRFFFQNTLATYNIHGVVFNWLLGWVYTPLMHPFIHLPRVPLIRPVGQHMQIWGKGQGKGKGEVKDKFSKCGTDSTVIEAVEGDIASLQRKTREIADCKRQCVTRACSCMGSV